MNVKEEVEKEESKLNETSLTDLPVANEQADAAKAGQRVRKDFFATAQDVEGGVVS